MTLEKKDAVTLVTKNQLDTFIRQGMVTEARGKYFCLGYELRVIERPQTDALTLAARTTATPYKVALSIQKAYRKMFGEDK